jgi:hypothetical protein
MVSPEGNGAEQIIGKSGKERVKDGVNRGEIERGRKRTQNITMCNDMTVRGGRGE